jgi:hypothetical protein
MATNGVNTLQMNASNQPTMWVIACTCSSVACLAPLALTMDGLVKATSQMRIDSFIMASGPIDEPEQQEQPSEEPERWGGYTTWTIPNGV